MLYKLLWMKSKNLVFIYFMTTQINWAKNIKLNLVNSFKGQWIKII